MTLRVTREWTGILCVCAAFVSLTLSSSARAATLAVTTTADPDNGTGECATGGACSLREAVNRANIDGGDTIVLPASASPYTLLNGPLTFTTSATLLGGGAAGTVISGGGATGILNVASPASVTVGGVTLASGVSAGPGGAVLVAGGATLTLSHDTLSGNTAAAGGGAIEDEGALTVRDSVITNNNGGPGAGGGIEVVNTAPTGQVSAEVTGTTISDNKAAAGGGAVSETGTGPLKVTMAGDALLGNATAGSGGAILNGGGPLSVSDTTLAGNQATVDGGGVDVGNGTTLAESFINDTIAGNTAAAGGDVAVGAGVPPLFDNTIVAAGTAPAGPDCSGRVTSGGGNLDDASGCGFLAAPHGTDLIAIPPKLGPLQSNGGPTETMALLPGSPAIDAGANLVCPVIDQRGVARPQGAACDIGAYELAPPVLGAESSGAVGDTSAVISAPVANPDVQGGTVAFQLGTSSSYGITSPPQTLPAGWSTTVFPVGLAGLTPGTIYHFRVVAQNPDGTVYGPDDEFMTTGSQPPTPLTKAGGSAGKFTFGPLLVSSSGRIAVALHAPGAGRFTATATFSVRSTVITHEGKKRIVKHVVTTYDYGTGSATSAAKSTVKLGIGLSGAGARALAKAGKATVTLTVTFTPPGGTARKESTRLTVHRSRNGRYS